ncbi:Aminoacyl carrier protein 1 [Enhygromyxa salina]|uniref:Aminoacyl carrier protein 1 n=1 Tax=Enhygromyxa salina TaxID=215803 RepID=A0A2S9XL27_9BACT|nr:acyl carrier protein [Enhygromyxa salina]PRP93391.1 Aminoacyl carrier protein 1 [Enhygromyxa salina]
MNATEVNQALEGFITEKLLHGDGADLTLQTPLLEYGIVDSLAMVSLLTFVQNSFGVTIPDGEVSPRNFKTIEALSALIMRVHGEASNGA